MWKIVVCSFICLWCGNCSAEDYKIPEAIRKGYALKFHEAFILQSAGLSTRAFYLFQEAYQEALRAGETVQKVIVLDELFRWYRTHGSWMHLFGREPTGRDQIVSSPFRLTALSIQSPLAEIPDYRSEWGNTPEQAAHIRMFMFGIAQTISGIFCVAVGGPLTAGVGGGLVASGIVTMFSSLNSAYADYERAVLDLKKIEADAKKLLELN